MDCDGSRRRRAGLSSLEPDEDRAAGRSSIEVLRGDAGERVVDLERRDVAPRDYVVDLRVDGAQAIHPDERRAAANEHLVAKAVPRRHRDAGDAAQRVAGMFRPQLVERLFVDVVAEPVVRLTVVERLEEWAQLLGR